MNDSWNELICPYFSTTVFNVLKDYFLANSFSDIECDKGAVIFKREDGCFIEIGYEMESSPNYTPTAIIGIGDKYDNKGNPNCAPFWFITPENDTARSYSKWKFSSEVQLQDVLTKLRDELIEKHAVPLWTDLSLLKDKILKFNSQIEKG